MDWLLLTVVLLLQAMGLLALASATYTMGWTKFWRQVVWMVLGWGIFLLAFQADFQIWARWGKWIYWLNIALLLLVLAFGHEQYRAQRWFRFGTITVQPSEFAKAALVVTLASFVAEHREQILTDFRLFLRSGFHVALPGRKPGEPVPLTFGHWPGVGPYTSPFGLAGTCVFVKQSPRPLICDPLGLLGRKVRSPYWGSPSPEVTGTFCRVPWRGFSRAPVDTLLAHLWRFPVRSPALRAALSGGLGKGFSWLPWGTTSPRKGGSLPPSQPSHGKVDSTVAADDHRRVGSLGRVPHP